MTTLDHAISAAGGVAKLARAIGVVPSAVSNWKMRGGQVPAEHCAAIEKASAGTVTRRDLRPDDWQQIWPELATDHECTQGGVAV